MVPDRPRILVLGAGGSLGQVIASAIEADPRLLCVRGLRRPPACPPACPAGEVRLVDAADIASLTRALDGISHVVNAVGGGLGVHRAVAAALCKAARPYPGLHLVHISSMAVYGAVSGDVGEDAPLLANTPYAAAKIAAEAELRVQMERGLSATILRPGIVHGPGSAQWTARLTRLLRARRLGDLGPAGDGFCNLIHERDLATACIAACRNPDAAGLAINLGSAEPPTWNAYLVALARASGATPVQRIAARRLALEARVLAAPLTVARKLAGPAARHLPDPIPPSLLRLFGQRIRLRTERAATMLLPPAPMPALPDVSVRVPA